MHSLGRNENKWRPWQRKSWLVPILWVRPNRTDKTRQVMLINGNEITTCQSAVCVCLCFIYTFFFFKAEETLCSIRIIILSGWTSHSKKKKKSLSLLGYSVLPAISKSVCTLSSFLLLPLLPSHLCLIRLQNPSALPGSIRLLSFLAFARSICDVARPPSPALWFP